MIHGVEEGKEEGEVPLNSMSALLHSFSHPKKKKPKLEHSTSRANYSIRMRESALNQKGTGNLKPRMK